PLAREAELLADRLERGRLAVEAEAKLEQLPLARRQAANSLADRLPTHRVTRNFGGIGRARVGEEIAELAAVVVADGLVQRNRRLDGPQRLLDVTQLQTGCRGQLLLGRRHAVLRLEPLPCACQLDLALMHVGGDANRCRLVRDRTLAS